MRLTPLDIRKQEFNKSFRGFDSEEVFAFLQMLSNQWQELLDDNRRLEERLREFELKLQHYTKVEEALEQALQTARESSRQAVENAERKAKMLLEEADRKAMDIRRDAEDERQQIKREASKIGGRRTEIVARLRAFLMSEMELLAHYEGDDPIGFIKLLPGEEVDRDERYLTETTPINSEHQGATIFGQDDEIGQDDSLQDVSFDEEDPELAQLATDLTSQALPEDDNEDLPSVEDSADSVQMTGRSPNEMDLSAASATPGDLDVEKRESVATEASEDPNNPFTSVVELEENQGPEPNFHDTEAPSSKDGGDDNYDHPSWVVRSLVTPDELRGAPDEEGKLSSDPQVPTDEIAKIRRILDDLD